MQQMDQSFVPEAEAARHYGVSPRTLRRRRAEGTGPPYFRFGRRVFYSRADLRAWAAARRFRNTSEEGGQGGFPEGRSPTCGGGGPVAPMMPPPNLAEAPSGRRQPPPPGSPAAVGRRG